MSEYTKVKIGDICRIEKGRTGIASATPGEYPLVVTAEERKTCNTYQFDCEAVCIPLVSSSGHGKKSLKNVHYQSGKFALGSILCAVIPNNPQEVNARYLHQYLQFYKDTLLVPLMKGAANVSLSMRDITKVEIPLPDFDTQTLLAKTFVEVQEKQKQLDAEFEKQTEYVKRLRQNILQEAIEGKITAEWRKTHPAEKGNPDFDAQALFEQIQKEKEGNSQQARKCVASSEAFPCGRTSLRPTPSAGSNAARNARLDDKQPFEIPESWKWVRLGDLCDFGKCQNIEPSSLNPDDWILDLEDIEKDSGRILSFRNFSENMSQSTKHIFKKNNVLYSKLRPYLNKVVVAPKDGCCTSEILPLDFGDKLLPKFMQFELMSPFFVSYTTNLSYGMKMPRLGTNDGKKAKLPLPSLAEQKEIVAKVESLLAKVTELENQIYERKKLSVQLMQKILKNAFAPQK